MSEETPKFRALTVQLFPGELSYGWWCFDCRLPSGIRQMVHVGRPDSETTTTISYCMNSSDHTRIEEI